MATSAKGGNKEENVPRVSVQWRGETYVGHFVISGRFVTVFYDGRQQTAETGDVPPGVRAWLTLVSMIKSNKASIRIVSDPLQDLVCAR